MHLIISCLILLLLIIPVNGLSADYIWPTNAPRLLSGTFGETRSSHFHSGIDIKTWARGGYECYAPADGYIERVVISPSGYGKALYIRLDDDRIVVFAHLDSFRGRLASWILGEQQRTKKVFINKRFEPGEFSVRKGDLVALSGHSGTVVPHIHFELRDSSNYPINPLLNGFSIDDKVPPEPVEIAFIPLTPETRVNGSKEGLIFPLREEGKQKYVIGDTVYVQGTVGVSLKAWDKGNYPHNRNGVYSITLYHNGREIFESRFDRLDWNQTHWMHEDRHYRLAYEGNGVFYTLYSFNSTQDMSFYRNGSKGHLEITEGIHNLVIQVRDANGNRSGVQVILKGKEAYGQVVHADRDDDNIIVTIDSLFAEREPDVDLLIERYNPYGFKEANVQRALSTAVNNRLKLKANRDENYVLSIKAIPPFRPATQPYLFYQFSPEEHPGPELEIIPRHFSSGLMFEILSNRVLPSSMQISLEGDSCLPLTWEIVDVNRALTSIIPPDVFEKYHSLKIYEYRHHEWNSIWNISPVIIRSENRKSFRSADDKLGVIIPENTFFRDVVSWIQTEKSGETPEGGEFVSDLYSLHPMDQPLHGSISIALRTDPTWPWHEETGLYRSNGDGKWSLVQADPEEERDYYRASIKTCGTFALLRDYAPPVIEKSFPDNGGRYSLKDLKRAWCEVSDNLSGIDPYKADVTLNGIWMVYYYNAPTKVFTMDFPSRLTPGDHTITWKIWDKAGHEQKKIIKFTLID